MRVAAVEFRQQQGQHVGCQRRNHPKPQAAAAQLVAVHTISKIMCGAEDRASASSDFSASLGEHNGGALSALHQLYAEVGFELADLH